jgi:hypothetical protein
MDGGAKRSCEVSNALMPLQYKSLGTILPFPGRWHGCRDQQYERKTTLSRGATNNWLTNWQSGNLVRSSEQLGCTAEPRPEKDRLHKRFEAAESAWAEVSVALVVAGETNSRKGQDRDGAEEERGRQGEGGRGAEGPFGEVGGVRPEDQFCR